jgi:nickel-dependent lactate racemase
MIENLLSAIKNTDIKNWKEISIEYGEREIIVKVPPNFKELSMEEAEIIKNPKKEIENSLENPVGSKKLKEIIKEKNKKVEYLTVAITVSDITRPVPYRDEDGILKILLNYLEREGIKKENIKIVIGNGTHRATTQEEKIKMFGEEIVKEYKIIDHNCEDESMLVYVGETKKGTKVYVNKYFVSADIKIATGLVETHFMAGVSGGAKAICPGLVDLRTIQKFHGVEFLESKYATNLVLEKNPCQKEAQEIGKKVGVDFLINVTLDKKMRLTGVFAGDLIEAHKKAVEKIKNYVEIPIEEEFDIVLTHSGYVGRNHYQTAKCAVSATNAVKKNGIMIIVANNFDREPIGSYEYKTLIHLLKLQGPSGYISLLKNKKWKFVKDQWEPQVWARVLKKVNEKNLFYLSPNIKEEDYSILPGVSGYEFLKEDEKRLAEINIIKKMTQNAIIWSVYNYKIKNLLPSFAYIKEGPYAVPVLKRK